ncbi:class I SAM-dependent methyltransferase [Campylobacter lari]|nr:class I SAM-dependent methyltransferase [Campylobacter lari]
MLNDDFFQVTKRSNGGRSLKENIKSFENDWKIRIEKRFELLKNKLVGKDILDFGSGHGAFLIKAKEYAKSVTGLEIEEQVDLIYKEHGISLERDLDLLIKKRYSNTNILAEDERGVYDIITAFHVIEHLQDPINVLNKLSKLLRNDGKIIIEVPNGNDALFTFYNNKAYQKFQYIMVHLFYFTPNSLELLAKKANLKVDFIKCVQRWPLSNTLYWLSYGEPAGDKHWGNFIDNPILQNAYEQTLASLGATDTLIAQFSKI